MGARCQDEVPFPLLQELSQEWGSDAEREALEALLAGRAGAPEDLRKAVHAGKPLDMEVTAWPSLPGAVILADECTDAQRCILELRARRPLLQEKIEKRRADLAERFRSACNCQVFQELRPTLEQ